VDKMAEYTLQILSDETVLKEMKTNAIEVAKTFDYNKIIPMYENLYQETIKEFKGEK
jgi:glycosyltransferase, group 1 family